MRKFELLETALTEERCLPGIWLESTPHIIEKLLSTLRGPIETQRLDFDRIAHRLEDFELDALEEKVLVMTVLDGVAGLEGALAAVAVVPSGFFFRENCMSFVRAVVIALAPDGPQTHRLLTEVAGAMDAATIQALTLVGSPGSIRGIILGAPDLLLPFDPP